MRIATGIFLLAMTAGVAHAEIIAVEPEPAHDVHPMKPFSWALYFSGVGGAANGVSLVALGPSAELALGFGRTQLFLDAGAYYAAAGTAPDVMAGFMTRGGVGARWIARSFEMDGEGAIEMVFDGLVGAEKYWFENGERLVRPEIAGGVGLQIRKFERPGFAVRLVMRVFFAPSDDEIHVPKSMTTARCTGSCEAQSHANGGIMFAIGGGL